MNIRQAIKAIQYFAAAERSWGKFGMPTEGKKMWTRAYMARTRDKQLAERWVAYAKHYALTHPTSTYGTLWGILHEMDAMIGCGFRIPEPPGRRKA